MADRLKIPLADVRAMSNVDYLSFLAYFSLEAERAELSSRRASRRRR